MAVLKSVAGSENLEVMREAENYNAFLRDQIRRHLNGCARVLDFGAGTGDFARALQGRDFEVVCVEPEPTLRAAIALTGNECHESLDQVPPCSIEGAYSLNVLEHIEDDEGTLRQLHARLRPGGALYLYVPAFEALFSAMDRRVGHLRRYRLGDLKAKCVRAGFVVEDGGYADSLGYFASLALKCLGAADGSLSARSVRLYDRAFFPASRLMDRACQRLFGKNVWVRARRPQAHR